MAFLKLEKTPVPFTLFKGVGDVTLKVSAFSHLVAIAKGVS